MTSKKFRFKSFRYAFDGFVTLLKTEPNSRIHLISASLAIILGLFLHIPATEWLFVGLCISLVFSVELINTSIERLADLIDKNQNADIRKIKDLSAAFVLVSVILSVVAGGVIFVPKIIERLTR